MNGSWYDERCDDVIRMRSCLCQRQPFFHMRLRGLCAKSAIDKYYHPMNDFSDFARMKLVGHKKSTIEYDEKSKNWKLSVAGSNVNGSSPAAHNTFLLGKQIWSINGYKMLMFCSRQDLK